jgi:hypothetical protein
MDASSSNCLTRWSSNGGGLWFGDLPCSGNGICNETSATCTCFSGYSGGGDQFDMRLFPNGDDRALDCSISLVGIQIIWSFTLFAATIRFVSGIILLVKQIAHNKREIKNVAFRISLIESLVTNPLYIATCLLKIIPPISVIGSDVAVTVCLHTSSTMGLVMNADFSAAEFRAMALFPSEEIRRRHNRRGIASILIYLVFALAYYVSLGMDKSQGPLVNFQYLTIIFRGIGVMGFFFFVWASNEYLLRELKSIQLIRASDPSSNMSSSGDFSDKQQKLRKLVEYFVQVSFKVRRSCFFMIALYLPFMLPFAWAYQGYIIAVGIFFGCLQNPSLQILRMQATHRSRNLPSATTTIEARVSSARNAEGQKPV